MKKVDSFKNRLKKSMELRGINATEIVNESNVLFLEDKIEKPLTSPLITNYLKGEYEAKQNNIDTLAQILNVDEAWLQGYDVPMNSEAEPILPDSEQKWEIKHNGMFTELYFNGTLIKNLKAIEFKHRVNESGKAELPILKLEVIVAQELKGAFDQDKAIKTATLESEVYKYFKK